MPFEGDEQGKRVSIQLDIIESWANTKGNVSTMDEIDAWLAYRANKLRVNIQPVDFSYQGFWFYDEKTGYIRNRNRSFFQLAGYQEIEDDHIVREQPVILQPEIGYLGIICKKIDGVLNFLMQAKIEPGNINTLQLSPTVQATKSNFTRMHGGKAPAYLSYFENSAHYPIIVDQIQSEQASRFYKKRNRNIIIQVDEEIPVLPSHCWMTLGQIKELLKRDNVVNMDTRTVLSCIPFAVERLEPGELERIEELFEDKSLFASIFGPEDSDALHRMFNKMNDIKMFKPATSRLVPLKSMKSWDLNKREIVCKSPFDYKVIYCRIEIEEREVQYWEQPLVAANGVMVLGLFTRVRNGRRELLVRVRDEIGCFDGSELSPSIQLEPTSPRLRTDEVESAFLERLERNEGVLASVYLSEEGGRFYHEQNRNAIIEVGENELNDVPEGYFWVDYRTLNSMTQYSNCLNIQLRNLLTLFQL